MEKYTLVPSLRPSGLCGGSQSITIKGRDLNKPLLSISLLNCIYPANHLAEAVTTARLHAERTLIHTPCICNLRLKWQLYIMVTIGEMMKEKDVSVSQSQMKACSPPPPAPTPTSLHLSVQDSDNWDFQRAAPGHLNHGCPGRSPRGGG